MARHFAGRDQTRGRLRLYTLITDVLYPKWQNKGNLDKNEVLKAISRDK